MAYTTSTDIKRFTEPYGKKVKKSATKSRKVKKGNK
jgi:hypothetical protein